MEGALVMTLMTGCAVVIVAASLYYHYKKEQIRPEERLKAMEKGIAPKDLPAGNGENGDYYKHYTSRRDSEIYGGIKILIVGLLMKKEVKETPES